MAKILDKLLPITASRTVKLHQRYNWLKYEHESLPGKYEERKNKQLNKFIVKANKKIAKAAFDGQFSDETIYKWLTVFIKRFFSQQFKRSCSPDGVKVGTVALSPRGDLKMPSDSVCALWLSELEENMNKDRKKKK